MTELVKSPSRDPSDPSGSGLESSGSGTEKTDKTCSGSQEKGGDRIQTRQAAPSSAEDTSQKDTILFGTDVLTTGGGRDISDVTASPEKVFRAVLGSPNANSTTKEEGDTSSLKQSSSDNGLIPVQESSPVPIIFFPFSHFLRQFFQMSMIPGVESVIVCV